MSELTRPNTGLTVTAPVVAELAVGARTDADEARIRRGLNRFRDLRFRGVPDLDAGVVLYRRCRQVGETPGGLIDCVIVAIALREGATLLTADQGQARVAQVAGVPLDPASATG
jgi:predicted nucleic acid-binding protein